MQEGENVFEEIISFPLFLEKSGEKIVAVKFFLRFHSTHSGCKRELLSRLRPTSSNSTRAGACVRGESRVEKFQGDTALYLYKRGGLKFSNRRLRVLFEPVLQDGRVLAHSGFLVTSLPQQRSDKQSVKRHERSTESELRSALDKDGRENEYPCLIDISGASSQQCPSVAAKDSLVLRHEIFVLDADLEQELNPKRYKQETKALVQELLKTLKMVELGPLQIYWAADQRAPGWSFIQPITTSHISGHYFEKPGKCPHIHIDIYSCDRVDYKKILHVLHKHLSFSRWSANFITRDSNHAKRRVRHIAGNGKKVAKTNTLKH